MSKTIDAMKQAESLFHEIYQHDDQHAFSARKGEEILNLAIAAEEAQTVDRAYTLLSADMLASDAQDEWHLGRAAGIEECEKLNSELQKQAQQVAVPQEEGEYYLIFFDDADRRPEMFTSRLAALHRYEQISTSWNAHLFVRVISNSRDAPQPPQAEPPQRQPMTCVWTQDDDGVYETACGEAFIFNYGTPAQNNAIYCHHCGGKIEVKP